MTYERPAGLHETTYSRGEELLDLARQLYLLRESLLRSAQHPTYYPDLFRSLRVLVVDGHRGRLGQLAQPKELDIDHTVPSMLSHVSPSDETGPGTGPDEWRDLRHGMEAMMFINPCSRWLELRNVQIDAPEPCRETSFWVYLEDEIISNKAEYGGPVSRQTLIAETANAWGVVHAARNYPTFLQGAQAWAQTGPYFLEVAQDVAYETLLYGRKVLNAGRDRYGDQITEALRFDIPIPAVQCGRCGRPLEFDQFECPQCGADVLPEPRRLSPKDRLSSIAHHSRMPDREEGTFSVYLDVSVLQGSPLRTIDLLEAEGKKGRMRMRRSGDEDLVWQVSREGTDLRAVWPVDRSPQTGRAMFFFKWSPGEVSITSETEDGELIEVKSDGTVNPLSDEDKDDVDVEGRSS